MLARERHSRILEVLESKGSVRTAELAEAFSVTDETIRRDLETLHSDALLIRTHGGAIAINHPARNLSMREREIRNLDRKQSIANVAERFLNPRDVVFFDGSSTALQLAKAIPDIDLTVVTNSHAVIEVLADRNGIEVIGTGGRFDSLNRCYGGALARHALSRYRVKTAFFSGNGIDLIRGLSESNEEQADLKSFALQWVERVILLADSTKIGVSSTYFFGTLHQVSIWITDAEAREEDLQPFRQVIPEILRADK